MNSFCICSDAKLNSIKSSVISSGSNNNNRKRKSIDSSSSLFENQLSNANVDLNSSLKIYLKEDSKELNENKNFMKFCADKYCDKDTLRTKREDDINICDTMKKMSEMQFKWVKF